MQREQMIAHMELMGLRPFRWDTGEIIRIAMFPVQIGKPHLWYLADNRHLWIQGVVRRSRVAHMLQWSDLPALPTLELVEATWNASN